MTKLVLASQSLGRKKLLDYLQIPYEIIPSEVDEDKITGKTPLDTLQLRARLKAENVAHKLTTNDQRLTANYLILSADSGAILDAELIGKPKNHADAVRILSLLSGRTHRFITAVYVIHLEGGRKDSFQVEESSQVTFRKLTKEDINLYLSLTDYSRYAASYALVSAQNFITRIFGSTSNIIGLPLELIIPVLKKFRLVPLTLPAGRQAK